MTLAWGGTTFGKVSAAWMTARASLRIAVM